MPPAPWSPRPRIRSPSVTTITSTCGDAAFSRIASISSRSAARDEQAAGAAVDVAELLAGQADRRRVDDRHHLGQVVQEQPVEQDLVGVLKLAEIDMPFEVGRLVPIGLVGTGRLLLQRLLVRRQQAEEAECTPFFRRERGPLVEQGAFEQQVPDERHLQGLDVDGGRHDFLDVHRLPFELIIAIQHQHGHQKRLQRQPRGPTAARPGANPSQLPHERHELALLLARSASSPESG